MTEAYNLLSNRERRRAYDLQLANARAQARRVGGLQAAPAGHRQRRWFLTVVHFDLGGRPGTESPLSRCATLRVELHREWLNSQTA